MIQEFHDSRERGPFPESGLSPTHKTADSDPRSEYASALWAELLAVVQRRENARRTRAAVVEKEKAAIRKPPAEDDQPASRATKIDPKSKKGVSLPAEDLPPRRCTPDSEPDERIVASARVSLAGLALSGGGIRSATFALGA